MLALIQLMLLKYLCDCLNSILILIHLRLLCSIIFYSIEEMHFHLCVSEFLLFPLYPCLFVLKFFALWVDSYMSRVLDLQQISPKRLCVFFSLFFWLVLCFFCILFCLLASLKLTISYMMFYCFCFISLFFLNFSLLIILECFASFPILSQYLFHLFLYCLNEVSLIVCTAILKLSPFNSLILKNSSFTETFFFI